MNTKRIIPVLLYNNGRLVLSRKFRIHQDIGDAYQITDRLKNWDVDELAYLNISPHWHSEHNFDEFVKVIKRVSENCFVPLSAGGGIRNIDDIHRLIFAGADRIILNSIAFDNPGFVTQAARVFGSQAIIVCMDVSLVDGKYKCFSNGGKKMLDDAPQEIAQRIEKLGAGEIIVQSMDNDGQGNGYDLKLLRIIAEATTLPIIALGGAGKWDDFTGPLNNGAGASAAANIFAFHELSYKASKDAVLKKNLNIRPGTLGVDYKAARHQHEGFNTEENDLWLDLKQSGLME